MSSILTDFGITEQLLGPQYTQNLSSVCYSPSPEQVKSVIAPLIPTATGIPLIRIGPDCDGSYLVPDDLTGIEACFSPGAGGIKHFEDELARRFEIQAYLCDGSCSVAKLATPLIDEMQEFERLWLEPQTTATSIRLDDWVEKRADSDSDLILQMDVEGAEFRNLLDVSTATLNRFRVIVVEFHHLSLVMHTDFLHGVLEPVLQKIAAQFVCAHAHPNNWGEQVVVHDSLAIPDVLEVTFLRRDRCRPGPPIELPHRLDVANIPSKPPVHLTGIWLTHANLSNSTANRASLDSAWQKRQGITESNEITEFAVAPSETTQRNALQPLLRWLRGNEDKHFRHIIQIGAGEGTATQQLLELCPEASIDAFEPDPRSCSAFRNEIRKSQVRLLNYAVSSKRGRAKFFPGGSQGEPVGITGGSLKQTKKRDHSIPFVGPISVRSVTLDDWNARSGTLAVDLLVVCAAGCEFEVIAGARQMVTATRYVYISRHHEGNFENQLPLEQVLAFMPQFFVEQVHTDGILLRKVDGPSQRSPQESASGLAQPSSQRSAASKFDHMELASRVVVFRANRFYRMADVVIQRGFPPAYNEWLLLYQHIASDQSFDGTILKRYISETMREAAADAETLFDRRAQLDAISQHRRMDILNKCVELHAAAWSNAMRPGRNEIGVHLRQGDLSSQNIEDTNRLLNQIRAYINADSDIATITIVTAFHYGGVALEDESVHYHFNENEFVKKKRAFAEFLQQIADNFPNQRLSVRSSKVVDDDFTYLVTCRFCICDQGGFSELVSQLRWFRRLQPRLSGRD